MTPMINHRIFPRGNPMYSKTRYDYLCGRHQLYRSAPQSMRSQASAARSFLPMPGTEMDRGPQTVEQLVDQGYFAVPAHDPETAILHDRKLTSWLGLDDCLGQIRNRLEIYERNMTDIEWGKCYAYNELARHGWPPSSEQENTFHKRNHDLHALQRDERVAAWKDVSRLRQALPESAHLYLSSLRKLDILNDTGGYAP